MKIHLSIISIALLLIVLTACQNRVNKNVSVQTTKDSITVTKKPILQKDSATMLEHFVDSLQVGKKKHNKIELWYWQTLTNSYVLIKFYAKQNNIWVLQNHFEFEKDGPEGCETYLGDYNNDNLKDVTYISASAARGANEVRALFIYDKTTDKLIHIKNSESYPNMLYNKALNCIDAFMVYGGCYTAFLKIKGDSLKEFASVELDNGLTVSVFDNKGKKTIIFKDTSNHAGFIRYKNFKPLQEYTDTL